MIAAPFLWCEKRQSHKMDSTILSWRWCVDLKHNPPPQKKNLNRCEIRYMLACFDSFFRLWLFGTGLWKESHHYAQRNSSPAMVYRYCVSFLYIFWYIHGFMYRLIFKTQVLDSMWNLKYLDPLVQQFIFFQNYIHFNPEDTTQIVTNSESQVIFYSWVSQIIRPL